MQAQQITPKNTGRIKYAMQAFLLHKRVGGIMSKNHEKTSRKFRGESFRNSKTDW